MIYTNCFCNLVRKNSKVLQKISYWLGKTGSSNRKVQYVWVGPKFRSETTKAGHHSLEAEG